MPLSKPVPVLTAVPAGPLGPVIPVSPVIPVIPVTPVAPVLLAVPGGPRCPVVPVIPVGPTNPVNPVEPEEPTELEQYLTLLETQFNDVYQQLVQSGNTKAVARVFAIKESFEEDYNISFKIINPSLGEGSEYPGTFPSLPD